MERQRLGSPALITAILVSVIMLAGCTGTQGSPSVPPASAAVTEVAVMEPSLAAELLPSGNAENVSDANNRFAYDLYSELAQDPKYADGNLFFSPFSLSSALAITYEGTRGATAEEIRAVFHFPENATELRQGYREILTGINRADTRYSLHTANAIWAEQAYPFLPAYISTAKQYYYAKVTNLNFISQPEASRDIINQWVEDETEDRIRNLIPEGIINPLTRLVITNAGYFKGSWETQFDADQTAGADFRVSPEKIVKIRMMQRIGEGSEYGYAETDDLQVLRLPYAHSSGDELSLLVILPKRDNLTAAEQALNKGSFTALTETLESQRVDVYLPKFSMETQYRLPDTLSAMGMPTAFTKSADLSGMDGTKNLFIRDVIHKAFVDVSEEGTEAAAATAVVVQLKAVANGNPVPVFRADHPFLFLIQDDENGTILFMGRVVNPSGA